MELSAGQQPGPPFKDVPWKSQLLVSAGLHAALFWVVVAWWPNSDHVDAPERQIIDVELVSQTRPVVEAAPSHRRPEEQAVKEVAKPTPVQQKKVVPIAPVKRKQAEPGKAPVATATTKPETPETGQAEKRVANPSTEAVAGDRVEEVRTFGSAVLRERPNDKTAAEEVVRAYQRQITELIESKKRYPLTARKGRQQGRVTVVFQLDLRGNLTASNVAGSSGYRLLDRAALKAVQTVDQFPALPAGLSEETRFQIDLHFRLK